MDSADAVVIGAGIIGSAAARALASRGVDTVLLEQFRRGHTRGSSHGATRIFRLSYPEPDYVPMCVRALALWRELEAVAGEQLLVTTGGLDAGPSAPACAEAMAAHGVAHEWLDASDAENRFPGMSFAGFERVLFQPDGGVTLAGRAVAAQVRVATALGAEVREECQALSLSVSGAASVGASGAGEGVTVSTPSGDIRARVVVLAAGPWSQALLAGTEGFGDRFTSAAGPKMSPTLQQITYFEPRDPDAVASWPTLIEWDSAAPAWYVVPMLGDAPGVKVGRHLPGRMIDPNDGPFAVDRALDIAHAAFVATQLPGLDPARFVSETCLYTMTADEDFVLDRVGPVVIGGGCSGHAFKFAPLLGEILADLATGAESAVPRARFALARDALARVPVDS